MKKIAVIVLSTLGICACSSHYSSNKDSMYTKSQNGATLVVPAPLTSSNISHFYDLPNPDKSAKPIIDAPKPPGLNDN